jgi:predicted dehydrogenase
VHQFPFQPGFRQAMARLETMGPVRQVSYTTCSAGAADADASAAARIAIEILPHPLSLFVRLLPSIADVAWSVRTPIPGEIRALGQAGEAGLAITISMGGRPTTNRLEIVGARGSIHVDLFHGFAVTFDGRVSRMRKATRPWHDAALTSAAAAANIARRTWDGEWAYPGLRALMRELYEAIRLGGPNPVPPAQTMAVARAGDRLAAAAAARQ